MNRRKRESVSVGPATVAHRYTDPASGSPFPSRDFKQTTQNRTHDIHTQNESLYDDNGATKYPTDGTASRFGRLIEALEIQSHPRRSHTRRERERRYRRQNIHRYIQTASLQRQTALMPILFTQVRDPSSNPRNPRVSRPTPHREEEEAKEGERARGSPLGFPLSLSLSFSLSRSHAHAASVPSFWTESPSIPAAPARRTLPTMTSWCQRRSRVGTAVRTCSRTW